MSIVNISNISIYIEGIYIGYAKKGILYNFQEITIDEIKLDNYEPPPDLLFKIRSKTILTYTYKKEKHAIILFLKDVVCTADPNKQLIQIGARFENDLGE